jgi:hypothetical protein
MGSAIVEEVVALLVEADKIAGGMGAPFWHDEGPFG